jgi:hypothetical protein
MIKLGEETASAIEEDENMFLTEQEDSSGAMK